MVYLRKAQRTLRVLCAFFLLIGIHKDLPAQQDSNLVYSTSFIKPGFYKSFSEYLHNSPSIATDFHITPVYLLRQQDSILIGCSCQLSGGAPCPAAWGLSDGHNIFISQPISLFKKRWLALQYIGKIPFFLYWHGDVLELTDKRADSDSALPYYHLMYVNENGKAKKINRQRMKDLLAAKPELLKRFMLERKMELPVFTKYLVLLNESE